MGASAMEARQTAERSARFIGIIERLEEGWRVSFRLRLPGEVFTQQGETDIFVSEMQATKWLHTQATARGFSSIEIRHQCAESVSRSQARRLGKCPWRCIAKPHDHSLGEWDHK
jgi:hypothetical protein